MGNSLGLSERVYKLREKVLATKPTICVERARFYTEAYRKYESMPVPVKRALALKETLEGMTVYIDDGELIVGNQTSRNNSAAYFPEYATAWMLNELDEFGKRPGDAYYPSEDIKAEIRAMSQFWQGRTTIEKCYALMPGEMKEILDSGIIKAEGNMTSGDAHIAVNNEKILIKGLDFYIHEVQVQRSRLKLWDWADLKKEQFYKSVEIGLKALQSYILRYAELAAEMAERQAVAADVTADTTVTIGAAETADTAVTIGAAETADTAVTIGADETADTAETIGAAEADGAAVTIGAAGAYGQRRRELQAIAENCRHISSDPPKTFYQALQLTLFLQLVLQIESNGHSLSLGRMDQYLHPFYKRDIEKGAIDEAFAMELLECAWIKLVNVRKIRPWSHTRTSAGGPLYQNVTIGGRTRDGKDAVNPLSLLILKSVGRTRVTQPNLSVRFHKGMSDDFLLECIKVIELGFGMPAFNNDEVVIPGLIKLGVEKEDAYDYSAIGCIEVSVPGKWGYRCTGMSFLNFGRVLLAALNNGYDNRSGKTFLPGMGSLRDFASFDQVMKAWKEQVKYYAYATVVIDTAVDTVLEENVPDIICSAFVDDCIDKGRFIKEGGSKYDYVSGLQVGIANLGNSLAAIKKLVFEDRRITARQLEDSLSSNFEGAEGEKVRQMLLNFAPKYGNDDDCVDLILKEAYMYFIEEMDKYHTTRLGRGPIGCGYYAGTSSLTANVPSGAVVSATPDGRKAFTPLAEGCSPSSGTDVLGPTAVFKSVSKLPAEKILGGVLLNQKLSPSTISGDADKKKLMAMLRTFFADLKGWHVQYNVVSREQLIAAKKEPEKYRDLIVRVAGYSAFFTNLAPETQDDIIARTEHVI